LIKINSNQLNEYVKRPCFFRWLFTIFVLWQENKFSIYRLYFFFTFLSIKLKSFQWKKIFTNVFLSVVKR
jgi:hypothetical protein